MCNVKNMNADLLQLCISRGVVPFPSAYLAFLEALSKMERENHVCLIPLTRLELFHLKLNPDKMSTKKIAEPVKIAR